MQLAIKPSLSLSVKPTVNTLTLNVKPAPSPTNKVQGNVARTAEDYKKLDHRTWVYTRPDTYVGSDERVEREEWIYDFANKCMISRVIDFTPACERLYLEILTNASDNCGESRRAGVDPGRIEIGMNQKTISITNYGLAIPIEIHPETGYYVPQMIFGDLLTGSNYKEERHQAGTNGIGAKAVNIFSLEFCIIIHNQDSKLKYTQVWRNNMLVRDPPTIEPYPKGPSSVQIIYNMDFARFKYPPPDVEGGGYPPEAFALYARHARDISFTAKIPVVFNGEEFNLSNIRDYSRLYFGDVVNNAIIHYQWPEGTEIVKKTKGYQISKNPAITPLVELIAIDTPDEGSQVSFVNCMMTRDGGVHVNAAIKAVGDTAVQAINETIIKTLTKRNKGREPDAKEKRANTININDVKPHISILLSVKVVNPKFTSQTKTVLASPTPKISLEEEELRPLERWRLMERLYATLNAKQYANMAKNEGKSSRFVRLKKGVDANNAGPGAKGRNAMLCIVEGNSASTYANKLASLVPGGRDNMGILPMRGKSLNVMDAERSVKSWLQFQSNAEINELKKMLGLRELVDYSFPENRKHLRYGGVMIMADSDVDGKHIIGLILLFFHCRFPSLLSQGYVMFYRTPIIRVIQNRQTLKFYTPAEYDQWKLQNPDYERWTHKYFKGLGSSKDSEIQDDFNSPRAVQCYYDEYAPDAMKLAFGRKMQDERKDWVNRWRQNMNDIEIPIDPYTFLIPVTRMQPISWFINEELILFSLADIQRSIPKLMDGFKESLRKIIYGAHLEWKIGVLDKTYKECKIAQFSAAVAKSTCYHHGEHILDDVIVGMAQDFVGANNIPWFTKDGQLGSRREGGRDAAKVRYVHTRPEKLFSYIFRKEDQPILTPIVDEGKEYEPQYYFPVIPMVLVNGAHGIGTGFSTSIPNHNPLDLVKWLRLKLNGIPDEKLPALYPWYRGFMGEIKVFDRRNKNTRGKINITTISPDQDIKKSEGEDEPMSNEAITDEEEDNEEEEYEGKETPGSRPLLSMTSYGKFHMKTDGTIVITDLPIGRWSLTYRKWLEDLREKKIITNFIDRCSDLEGKIWIYFEITGFKETPNHRNLRLQKTIGMSNMYLLNEDGYPSRYDTANDIIEAFYYRRLPIYLKRKNFILNRLNEEVKEMNDRIRYIRAVAVDQILEIRNRPQSDTYADMDRMNLPRELLKKVKGIHLSAEEVEKLSQEITNKIYERDTLEQTTPEQIWLQDLQDFETAYRKFYSIPNAGPKLAVVRPSIVLKHT